MAINSLFQSVGSQGLAEEWPIMKREKIPPLCTLWFVGWVYRTPSALSGVTGLRKIAFGETECIMHLSVRERDKLWQYSILVGCLRCAWLHLPPSNTQLPKWPQSCRRDWWTGADKEHLSATYKVTSGRPAMLQCSVWRGGKTQNGTGKKIGNKLGPILDSC